MEVLGFDWWFWLLLWASAWFLVYLNWHQHKFGHLPKYHIQKNLIVVVCSALAVSLVMTMFIAIPAFGIYMLMP